MSRVTSPQAPTTAVGRGLLILNADDWGSDRWTTDRTLDCVRQGGVSSVSAMVYMPDSERAAAIAGEHGIEAGLHLNLTTAFSGPGTPASLVKRQAPLARFLRGRRLAPVVFHPGLRRCFEYVVAAQLDEFRRLYGRDPDRIDGHHHMHLCANVLWQRLLPSGTLVRRSFSFQRGERSLANVLYRRVVDGLLARRYRLVDFFFSLAPLQSGPRLRRIFELARDSAVEVEVHAINPAEYRFVTEGHVFRAAGGTRIARPSMLGQRRPLAR